MYISTVNVLNIYYVLGNAYLLIKLLFEQLFVLSY